jgi:hypothetical protein
VGLPLWTAVRLLGPAGLGITHIEARDLLPQCAKCPLRLLFGASVDVAGR